MSAFAPTVAALTGVAEDRLRPIGGDSVSDVLLVPMPDGRRLVAKSSPDVAVEASMLRAIRAAGVPSPKVEAEHAKVLLIEHVENDGLFNAHAWRDAGTQIRRLHECTGAAFGWPLDYSIGTVVFDNRERRDWPGFWAEQRLVEPAFTLDRPWRQRIERLAVRLPDLLPAEPPAVLLHGDLWSGNMLVHEGRLAALIDPACYHGHAEVDLAMLDLFASPPPEFGETYGTLDPGWQERRPIYQLFPAIVHVRLWGVSYLPMLDRLLAQVGFRD